MEICRSAGLLKYCNFNHRPLERLQGLAVMGSQLRAFLKPSIPYPRDVRVVAGGPQLGPHDAESR